MRGRNMRGGVCGCGVEGIWLVCYNFRTFYTSTIGGRGAKCFSFYFVTVDDHHTTEDTFLALGTAFKTALGPRTGLARFGHCYAPLDEALSRAVVDISSRPFFVGNFDFEGPMIGQLNSQMVHHGLSSWAMAAGVTLHVDVIRGCNDHHRAESAFKALAGACRMACARLEGKEGEVGSTKGVL